jgi:pseudouridine-5'-phosphate glycosidase
LAAVGWEHDQMDELFTRKRKRNIPLRIDSRLLIADSREPRWRQIQVNDTDLGRVRQSGHTFNRKSSICNR